MPAECSRAVRQIIRMPIPIDTQRRGDRWVARLPGWDLPLMQETGETRDQAIDHLRWALAKYYQHTEGEL